MRIIFGEILMAFLAFQAPAAVRTIIPNGGAAVGNLSVINPATGVTERSLVTAISGGPINDGTFAITNTGGSAAVLGISSDAYLLSVVNLSTGKITAQQKLSVPLPPAPAGIAANPKMSFLYLTYEDSSRDTHIQKIDAHDAQCDPGFEPGRQRWAIHDRFAGRPNNLSYWPWVP